MSQPTSMATSLDTLDPPTVALVRLAAAVAAGGDAEVRAALSAAAAANVPPLWIDELILQSYLFSGFPRALNAAREWRRMTPAAVSAESVADPARADEWLARGETTCAAVYGDMYDKLRRNVFELHPALDAIMVMDGYGKVLGRPGLDLPRRELCVVAACAATGQDRQLHSHLHGALNVGVSPVVLGAALDALAEPLGADRSRSARLLLARVVGK
ncbi:MAG: carboxymuconolactone decarboxylase family protein [Gemmatimonadaceae bacterium]|nr:carboxymuconolactone decarboxylase family protein [Gemmatimonadaceae bacterium]NUO96112.1 carboxymuconolactone decarboxylase family protein [Gemmatimonadaceae bacterium]NUP55010.1 carboxymuconolactone decarboxylase family protein [Gemmatimonadaceae bacterium]NUP73003.1 carboxymuconolactone decarboxylase family protein [Gemmatimonadaceae bacterium]NUR34303.1 carboxymuconolactone decarboxylase family protein [Gemmatimonadaceae bacterium]